MALGGGNFLVQNKIIPGTYINFVSVPRVSNIFADRGRVALALPLDWGPEGVMIFDTGDLQRESKELLGYDATAKELRPIREALLHAKELYLYRLGTGGQKATLTVEGMTVTAKYPGTRGNALSVLIEGDIDRDGNYLVSTFLEGYRVGRESVATIQELVDNPYVDFTGDIVETVEVKLEGGTSPEVTNGDHSDFLTAIEAYDVNAVGYAGENEDIKNLYVAFVKRLRDQQGIKTQVVLYNKASNYEGIINVTTQPDEEPGGLVYWVAGASAGCNVNESLDNTIYDGEYTLSKKYKQRELEQAIKDGEFVFHSVDNEYRVLSDINSFTDFKLYKNEDFSKNQIIRVIDQIAKDASVIFNNRYLGKVQNNEDGRISLWKDLVHHAETLQNLGAIEDFEGEDIVVVRGEAKEAVDVNYTVTPVLAMQKLYMVVRIA